MTEPGTAPLGMNSQGVASDLTRGELCLDGNFQISVIGTMVSKLTSVVFGSLVVQVKKKKENLNPHAPLWHFCTFL